MRTAITILVVVILLGIFGPQLLFAVDETQMVVVKRFGEIRRVYTTPGIKVKTPFIDERIKLDKRVLRVDIPAATMPDKDQQFLVIDAYVRYRIKQTEDDVIKFFQRTAEGNLRNAEERLKTIVVSALREEVAKSNRQEIIGGRELVGEQGEKIIESTETRQKILNAVLEAARRATSPAGEEGQEVEGDFGVEIIDVRMKRADFPDAAIDRIFTRMRSERDLISAGLRAQGDREARKIRANAEKTRTITIAEATRRANLIKGEGEARAVKIFADALQEDPEFFAFQASLAAYKKFLPTNSTLILSSESELFQFLQDTRFITVNLPEAFVGPIESMTGNVWTIGGRKVQIAGATGINTSATPENGAIVFVEGSPQEDGALVAGEVLDGVTGFLEKVSLSSLVVESQEVSVTGLTKVVVEPERVTTVYVEGRRQGDTVVAGEITEGLRGSLERIGDLTWTVGISEIQVGSGTQIEDGAAQIGAEVLVSIRTLANGSLVALKVASADPPEGEAVVRLVGIPSAVTHQWKIRNDDRSLTVGEDTDLELGANQEGLVVLIGAQRQEDGSLLALKVRVQ
jgi:membrane protease subunit HflC